MVFPKLFFPLHSYQFLYVIGHYVYILKDFKDNVGQFSCFFVRVCVYLPFVYLSSSFNVWIYLKSWPFIFSESVEEQDVLDNSTEQTEEKISDTEQTNQGTEKVSGTEEPEEKQEAENEDTSMNEAKSVVPRADPIPNPELSGESLMAM